jgi:hypothetical protein
MDIQSEHTSLTVQIQEPGSSTAWKPAHRSLDNPALGEQFLNNKGDGASLKPRGPGKVGARNRLPGSDLVENEIPIDLPGNLIRRAYLIDKR